MVGKLFSFSRRKLTFFLLSLAFTFLLLGAGCSHRRPEVNSPARGRNSFSLSGSDTMPASWWDEFQDPLLGDLVERALGENLSLRQSWDRLREARALAREAGSDFYPSVDVTAGQSYRKQRQGGATENTESTSLGLSAAYELDLWGRIESRAEAARLESEATRQDLRAAAVSLAAEVSRTWFELVAAYGSRELLDRQLETGRDELEAVENRFRLGKIHSPELEAQRRRLESIKQQRARLNSTIETLENELAVLLGRVPAGRVNVVRTSLPELPELPETGLPSRVIERRPDVRSAYLNVKSANREVAAAMAERYPRFTINAGLSTSAGDGVALFEDWVQSIAADFSLPLFDAGARRARVESSRAALASQVKNYKATVLAAYREIEDSLARERQLKKQVGQVQSQLKSARESLRRTRVQYQNGVATYTEVLSALGERQQLQQDLLDLRKQQLQARVGLYRSLAGGPEVEARLSESE